MFELSLLLGFLLVFVLCRSVPRFSLCKRKGKGRSTLTTLHLEHNQIDLQQIPPAAFTCIDSTNSIVLEPQGSSGPQPGAEGALS